MKNKTDDSLNNSFKNLNDRLLETAFAAKGYLRLIYDQLAPFLELHAQIEKMFENVKLIEPSIDWPKTLETLKKIIEELPEQLKETLLLSGKHGWFYDSELPLSNMLKIKRLFEEGKTAEAEAMFISYYKDNLADIELRINTSWSKRAKIITAAFEAHRNGKYELSIPVMLIQADGIFGEIFSLQLCKARHNHQFREAQCDLYAYPLSQPLPLSLNEFEREENFQGLNRHLVLHGKSVDYPSEINSLKTISLLSYVASLPSVTDMVKPIKVNH